MQQNILWLASKSTSRRQLLIESKLSFQIIEQEVDETQCDWALPLQQLVTSIALHKMESVKLPEGIEDEQAFILTADTLTQDKRGKIFGKPSNRQEALEQLKAAAAGMQVATGFCLEKRIFFQGAWLLEKRIEQCVQAYCEFVVPENWVNRYLDHIGVRVLEVAGAIEIEGFGWQFLKRIDGSYTTILGLPLFEVREALEKIGFFKK